MFANCTGIPADPAATAFWQAPKRINPENSCLEILAPDGQLAEDIRYFGSRFRFSNMGPKLFYRKAYGRLRYELESLRRAIIIGTPGTWKSVFGAALVCEASMQENPPHVIYQYTPWTENNSEYYVFLGDQGYYVRETELSEYPSFIFQLSELMKDPNTLLIVDGAINRTPYMSIPCKVLQIVPPEYS